jgi:S1-C subfamily serine protease
VPAQLSERPTAATEATAFGDSDALEVGDTVLAVGSIGVGFAIPSQRVAQVVGQLTGDTQMLATSSATG